MSQINIKKILKSLLILAGSLMLILVLLLGSVQFFFKDKLIQFAVKQINNEVDARISYSGYNLVLWKTFPNVSVEFKDFTICPLAVNNHNNNDTILKSVSTYFEFGLFKILTNRYELKRIQINIGNLNLITFENGISNFDILKRKTTTNTISPEFYLNSIVLKDCHVHYSHAGSLLDINVFTNKSLISGKVKPQDIDFFIKGDFFANSVLIKGVNYINNKEITIKTKIKVLYNTDYIFENSEIIVHKNVFNWSGKYLADKKHLTFNIVGEAMDFEKILTMLPQHIVTGFQNYKVKGKCALNFSIDGKTNQYPLIKLGFSVSKAQIEEITSKIKLNNLELQGIYSNGKDKKTQQSYLQLNKFSANMGPGSFSLTGTIHNLLKPKVNVNVSSKLNLKNLKNFLRLDTLEIFDGNIACEVQINGLLPHFSNLSIADSKHLTYTGEVIIDGAAIKLKSSDYYLHSINGTAKLNNDIYFSNLTVSLHENPIVINGVMVNGLPFIFGISKQTRIIAELESKNLDLSKYFSKEKAPISTVYSREFLFPENIELKLKLNINEFKLNKFSAKSVRGEVVYQPGIFEILSASFATCEGLVKGNGTIIQDNNKDFYVKGIADINKLDIKQMFVSFNNFSQDVVRHEHLKGKVSGKVNFSSVWNKRLEFYPGLLVVDANITVFNGELLNFQPLYGLSKFISLDELQNVKFTTLHNTIYIKDKQIIIPQMEIQSSAFNIIGSGTHTFDKHYNYKVRILLSEFLFRKAKSAKKENEEFGQVEDDGLGRTTIPLKIEGFGSNYKVEYDPKSTIQIMKESLNKQKTEMKQILHEEFGWFKKDSTTKTSTRKDKPVQVNWDEPEAQPKNESKTKNKKDSDKKPQFEFE